MAKTKERYLWQVPSGHRFIYSEALAKRKDMVEFDPSKKKPGRPMAKDVPAPPDFIKLLNKCVTRTDIVKHVKSALNLDIERVGSTTAMKKKARELFKSRIGVYKGAAKDDSDATAKSYEEIEAELTKREDAIAKSEAEMKAKAEELEKREAELAEAKKEAKIKALEKGQAKATAEAETAKEKKEKGTKE